MPGFIAHIGKEKMPFAPVNDEQLHVDNMSSVLGYFIERRIQKQDLNDSLFVDTGRYAMVIDGQICNKSALQEAYRAFSWPNCIARMYEKEGDRFFRSLIGTYAGLFYDKHQDKWLVFANEQPIFYVRVEEHIFVASDQTELAVTLRLNNLSKDAIEQLPSGSFLRKSRHQEPKLKTINKKLTQR